MKEELLEHITIHHNKAQAATNNDKDNAKSETESDNMMEYNFDKEAEDELRNFAKVKEVDMGAQDMIVLGNMIRVDNIVESFVDSAFREMNPDVVFPKPVCHDCVQKDKIYNNQEI